MHLVFRVRRLYTALYYNIGYASYCCTMYHVKYIQNLLFFFLNGQGKSK